ncbi:hypothetical protein PGT21_014597 [Puccinia graminis f. sp. tritici]|uniref:Uncharacterized protein n=1 Tax=Puccinia graminis f. sp. tritici TaxID=56615 RepID=A0A5B0S4L3_PUCGR|nr:hypothetical protein PGT21_014597 [Puccinia graminis f. sp. tritici]KAA1132053.1 hypothetical protein PGTUg99_036538 [Puccinia graminis f. sp. tritici]
MSPRQIIRVCYSEVVFRDSLFGFGEDLFKNDSLNEAHVLVLSGPSGQKILIIFDNARMKEPQEREQNVPVTPESNWDLSERQANLNHHSLHSQTHQQILNMGLIIKHYRLFAIFGIFSACEGMQDLLNSFASQRSTPNISNQKSNTQHWIPDLSLTLSTERPSMSNYEHPQGEFDTASALTSLSNTFESPEQLRNAAHELRLAPTSQFLDQRYGISTNAEAQNPSYHQGSCILASGSSSSPAHSFKDPNGIDYPKQWEGHSSRFHKDTFPGGPFAIPPKETTNTNIFSEES